MRRGWVGREGSDGGGAFAGEGQGASDNLININ